MVRVDAEDKGVSVSNPHLAGPSKPAHRDSRLPRGQNSRQQHIAELVFSRGTMRVEELIEMIDVSPMTLYRDLAKLEQRRVIHRSRGEVSAAASSLSETSVRFRTAQETAEKKSLVTEARKFVNQADSVFIDDSTTACQLIDSLADGRPLTVMTNSLTVSRELVSEGIFDMIFIGGRYVHQLDAFFGPMACQAFDRVAPDLAIVGAAAIRDGAIFHPYEDVAVFKEAALAASRRKILLATASKFSRTAMHRIAGIDEFDAVITDATTDPADIAWMEELTTVIVADPVGQ